FNGPTTGTPLLTVTLNPGVSVTSPGGGAVALSNANVPTANGTSTFINAIGTAASPIIINNINPGGINNWGLVNQPGSAGAAVINATNTQIDVNGTQGDNGIWAISYGVSTPNVARVTYDAGATSGVTSSGINSTGIQAENRANGDAIIDHCEQRLRPGAVRYRNQRDRRQRRRDSHHRRIDNGRLAARRYQCRCGLRSTSHRRCPRFDWWWHRDPDQQWQHRRLVRS